MEFRRYDHLERLGHVEVEGIADGTVYVFPKLDGTNSSIWLAGNEIQAGSRNRTLSLEQDNAGFLASLANQTRYGELLGAHPFWVLYGEWLVPHTLKTYRDDAWRRFWVFDVRDCEDHAYERYVPYDEYAPVLEQYGIDFVPPNAIIRNPTDPDFLRLLESNTFLIRDGEGPGEGIVLKNYGWRNKFGHQVWAKIVRNEFKEKARTAFGTDVQTGTYQIECAIAEKYVTAALVDKTLAKITQDQLNAGATVFDKKSGIPRLLQTVYYEIVREELWAILKEHKSPTIDFKKLQRYVQVETKAKAPSIFGRELVA